jgi:glycosyltransferase involved in cell wall biosynthesis
MRILCLATEFPPAAGYGLGRYAHEHCQALVQAGAEVDVVCNNYDAGAFDYEEAGIRVFNVPFLVPFQGYSNTADILQGNVTLFTRAAELVRAGTSYDVIQVHDWLAASAGVALQESFGLPLVVTMHDTALGKALGELSAEEQYIADMERWICTQADAVCANSESLKRELMAAYGVPEERITVVGCGVNPERFEVEVDRQQFKSLFGPPQEPLVLFVGRLTPLKGPQVLLEAFREIAGMLPQARLVFTGDGAARATTTASAGVGVGVAGPLPRACAGPAAGRPLSLRRCARGAQPL